mmetsp:Transcript_22711/g.37502  ORF Transcript_22711/g.37502 Transcript_22711/m.37502 type:complete len:160 (+) Transcript_22711:4570-5049(+)
MTRFSALIRPVAAFFVASLSACAPQYVETLVTSEQDLPVRRALFTAQPDPLDTLFRSTCDSPGDVLRQVSASVVQCRQLPRPDLAAFLLLQYDGALEAPSIVVQKSTSRQDDQFLVEMSYFAEVIQKSGNPRRIYYREDSIDDLFDALLVVNGGTPANG